MMTPMYLTARLLCCAQLIVVDHNLLHLSEVTVLATQLCEVMSMDILGNALSRLNANHYLRA